VLILLPPSEKKVETTEPTPAIAVYQGVLYQALEWTTLSPAARARGETFDAEKPRRLVRHRL
jgi:hypothetical protein